MLLHNITEEDVRLGHAEYLKYGAGSLKKKTGLTQRNIWEKALLFIELHLQDGPLRGLNFQQTLLEMMRTGKYFPCGWLSAYGGKGLNHERAAAQWRLMTSPQTARPEDIHRCVGLHECVCICYFACMPPLLRAGTTVASHRCSLCHA